MMELQKGRPMDTTGRLAKETRTYDLLDRLGIEYNRIDHAPAMTMEVCQEIDRVLHAVICKNLFLCNRQQTDFYLLLMPGKKVFKTKFLSEQINSSRLSFGSGEQMEELLGVTPGSATVFGLMNDKDHRIRLLIDRDLLKDEYLGCHPCVNTSVVKIRTQDILDILLPHFGVTPTFVDLPDPSLQN